jgi:hypothetical protein
MSSCAETGGHTPKVAVLCWRRIPEDRSGRAAKESGHMLLGSEHGVPMDALCRR